MEAIVTVVMTLVVVRSLPAVTMLTVTMLFATAAVTHHNRKSSIIGGGNSPVTR